MQPISIAIRTFNDKVKQLTQTNGRQLTMSADEAKNLHSDIFALLTNIAELTSQGTNREQTTVSVNLDGGNF